MRARLFVRERLTRKIIVQLTLNSLSEEILIEGSAGRLSAEQDLDLILCLDMFADLTGLADHLARLYDMAKRFHTGTPMVHVVLFLRRSWPHL